MKPDWKDIPDWVEWIAMDNDGGWCGYENKPKLTIFKSEWYDPSFGRWSELRSTDHENSLEQRPK